MTTKTKMSNLESFQELSIQISCLDMKLTKILELLNKPAQEQQTVEVVGLKELSYEDWETEFK